MTNVKEGMPSPSLGKLLLDIWTQPRSTMRYILDTNPDRALIPILLLVSVASISLEPAAVFKQYSSDALSSLTLLGKAIITGLVFWQIGSYLYTRIGKLLGGVATFKEVKSAWVWGGAPQLILLPFVMISLFFPTLWFLTGGSSVEWSETTGYAILALISVPLQFWIMIIGLKCLAEAHRISVWRSFLAALISWLTILLTIILLCVIVRLFYHS